MMNCFFFQILNYDVANIGDKGEPITFDNIIYKQIFGAPMDYGYGAPRMLVKLRGN